MTDPTKRAVVLLSGGLDSCVVATWAKKWHDFVYPLSFAYGSIHNEAELRAAQNVAHALGLTFQRKGLGTDQFQNSALIDGRGGNEIPGRNTLFLAYALVHALNYRCGTILLGSCKDDHVNFPDTRPNWLWAAGHLTSAATNGQVKVFAPLSRMTKVEVVRMGLELGAPMHLTYTCYKGTNPPCGECDSCKLRAAAFAEVGVPDPALIRDAVKP